MRALTWQGNEHVEITDVPDPQIQEPNDVLIRVTSTAICGSDLHLYGVLGPFLKPGDVLGHEAMGIVEEVGADITRLRPGDRVVVPFNISCGHCWMCRRGLFAQCETTQVRSQGKGAALFGYTSLYGSVPGGQAQYLRVPQAQFGPVKVPAGAPDEQYLTSPTSCPPPTRPWPTPTSPTAAPWPCWAWGRSGSWRHGSPGAGACPG
jgi:threonine dehydrogenase-like Zn-dependent dehydrogenase